MVEEIWRGRQWCVTTEAIDEIYDGPDDQAYRIEASDLVGSENAEAGWPYHMAEKPWVDYDEFLQAFLIACVFHRVEASNIRKLIKAGEERRRHIDKTTGARR